MAVSSSVTRAVFGEQPSFQDVSKTVLVHFAICLIVRLASHTSSRNDFLSQFVPRGESESISHTYFDPDHKNNTSKMGSYNKKSGEYDTE